MKGKREIAWLLSTAMLTGMMSVTSLAEGKLSYVTHQEYAADCGFTEGEPCRHKIHTKECLQRNLSVQWK